MSLIYLDIMSLIMYAITITTNLRYLLKHIGHIPMHFLKWRHGVHALSDAIVAVICLIVVHLLCMYTPHLLDYALREDGVQIVL